MSKQQERHARPGAVTFRADPGDPRHGTENGYTNLGCRCAKCRAFWSDLCTERRARRRALLSPDDPRHGKSTTFTNHSCRCESCRAAWAAYNRNRTKRAPTAGRHPMTAGAALKPYASSGERASQDLAPAAAPASPSDAASGRMSPDRPDAAATSLGALA